MQKTKIRDKKAFKKIEDHLRNYRNYVAGIRNMEKQLEYILPNITATYEIREGTVGTFTFKSTTEDYAIDRIEGKRALHLHEDIAMFQLVIDSIDVAINELEPKEQEFVKYRYIQNNSTIETALKLDYTERNLFYLRQNVKKKLLISLKSIAKIEI
ncbi:sigma-70 family RNA polymerase sigma factor [Peribacillus frigoritolerans]|uniref:sigma-70 family RNA polymerase sigma factor n=1 Tax=Peribacillus frigoritolerans TaxID=450367 RepID=UPI0021D18484|nr:sigma-70 family RNA polymerase sigma factor [Peribacillus frigoritolerans]MCU6603781.1 sigma-70 family RNA polymerase sigma factor [Peribacillus frigoritolerans]